MTRRAAAAWFLGGGILAFPLSYLYVTRSPIAIRSLHG